MTWLSLFVRLRLLPAVLLVLAVLTLAAAAPSQPLTFRSLLDQLIVLASGAVGAFVIAVGLDILAGILLAVKTHTFDAHKLSSFLRSQFGTKEALALAGIVATATTSAVGAALLRGGLTTDALQAIADAAFAAATAGAAALLLAVLADVFAKVGQLAGREVPAIKT